jgi:hypothetical protein
VISDPLETVVGGEFLKIDAVVLLVAIITTLFSAMDMAWHEAIKSTVNSSKKEKIGFLGLQCSMLLVSFCIFAVTVVLLGLVSDLIK